MLTELGGEDLAVRPLNLRDLPDPSEPPGTTPSKSKVAELERKVGDLEHEIATQNQKIEDLKQSVIDRDE